MIRASLLFALLFAGAIRAEEQPWSARIEATRAAAVEAHARDKEVLAALDDPMSRVDLALKRLKTESERLVHRPDAPSAVSERAADLLVSSLRRYRKTRARLDDHTLPQIYRELADVQAERVRVGDRIWELELPLDGAEPPPAGISIREYRISVRAALVALRDRVATLEAIEVGLAGLESKYQQQRAALTEMIALVLSKSYWLRTDPVVGADVARRARDESMELLGFLRAAEWSSMHRGLLVLILGILGATFAVHLRLRRATLAFPYRGSPLLQGVQVTAAALVAAAIAPGLLLAADALIGGVGPDARPISVLIRWTAAVWWIRAFLRRFFRPDGIAMAHWGMPADCAALLLRGANIGTLAALVFLGPSEALREVPLPLAQLPRLLGLGYLAGITTALLMVLNPAGAVVAAWTGRRGLLYRSRGIWTTVAALGLLAIVVMQAMGYRLGARMLMDNVLKTVAGALVLTGLYRMLASLVDNLASRVRRRALEADSGRTVAREQSQAVTAQLTRVVTVGMLLAAAFALIQFWDVQAGVRTLLDSVRVYSGEGSVVTLWDLAKAVLWIAGGHFLVANLAGLYEFLVFPLLARDDAGGRFVFLALARYAIFVVAYSAALLSVNFSFSSLGWILAAMSVGLGFGLQEIVANFVSGLILLLEGPIRIGDIITVGQTGGVVERIAIRATIVVNWDRQVIIVPNKRFITEELTNWTRNDDVVRRKLTVGVRYGSDVALVFRILNEVLAAHPDIVADPPPRVWFEEFGESSLNFEIWFFAEIMAGRKAVSDLRTAIDERFRAEGVEIPFPQRDLHVRSIDDDALAAMLGKRAAGRPPAAAGDQSP